MNFKEIVLKRQLQIYDNTKKQEVSSNEKIIAYLDSVIVSKNKEKIKSKGEKNE